MNREKIKIPPTKLRHMAPLEDGSCIQERGENGTLWHTSLRLKLLSQLAIDEERT
jgi:hypothetical protein